MIYAIRAEGTEFVKFGKATDPVKRLSSLQTSCPLALTMTACADWPDLEEPLIHIYLSSLRERGEWFRRDALTEKVIGLLRDGEQGLREWHRISRGSAPERSWREMALRRLANA